jgi:MFS superfamily sulfate permease-like transporter
MASASKVSDPAAKGDFMADLPSNLKSGFMVFLIALPLCLAISTASGCPAIAGVFTAIAGGILTTFISNSELTIKGPAAGLIVIVVGCVMDYNAILTQKAEGPRTAATAAADSKEGSDATPVASALSDQQKSDIKKQAYRMTLAVCVAAGICQIAFGLLRTGVLGEFFPSSAVHGLLAAIGVIIIAKQIPVALGVPKAFPMPKEPLHLILDLPHIVTHFNPYIAMIGIVSLIIMFGMPMIAKGWVKKIPAQLITLIVAIIMAQAIGLPAKDSEGVEKPKEYVAMGRDSVLSPEEHLVNVPAGGILAAVATPDWNAFQHPRTAIFWIVMFSLIGSLESLLSAKAVDLLDPLKRKTNLDRDLLAIGVANTAVGFIGGIPMISEIVRSRANIDNGAKSRWSDFFHGLFLLGFVAAVPWLLHMIPMAALAAMLIFTGFRLAHPREFKHVLHIGREQLVVFVATIVGILATDLLIGIFIGIGVKLLIHFINGVPLWSLFKPFLTIEQINEKTCLIKADKSAVFSNWILMRRQIFNYGLLRDNNLIVDMSGCKLVDHTVMEKLQELKRDFADKGLTLELRGLDQHLSLSDHPTAARRRGADVVDASEPAHH